MQPALRNKTHSHVCWPQPPADQPLQVPEGEIGIIAANVQLGFASSNKQARQKVLEGAIRIHGEKITDPHYIIVIGDEPVKLSFGAKRHALLTR